MAKIFIKPAEGRLVRYPRTMKLLPDTGASVDRTPYWIRRLKSGDVEEAPSVTVSRQED